MRRGFFFDFEVAAAPEELKRNRKTQTEIKISIRVE